MSSRMERWECLSAFGTLSDCSGSRRVSLSHGSSAAGRNRWSGRKIRRQVGCIIEVSVDVPPRKQGLGSSLVGFRIGRAEKAEEG